MPVFIDVHELPVDVRLIDTRFSLKDIGYGRESYAKGHIAGSVYWDLNEDLSDLSLPDGRHPLPSREQLQTLFETSGLDNRQMIAIYDGGGEPFAARAYWILSYAGFDNIRIVNGGYDALVAAGYPVVREVPDMAPVPLTLSWRAEIYADREEVKAIVDGHVDAVLLDAREEVRYLGQSEPIDPVSGRIPGARNFFWGGCKTGNSLFPPDGLKQVVSPEEPIVVYCGSGVTAAPLYAVLKEAGYEKVKMYVGSYSDWIRHYEAERSENG